MEGSVAVDPNHRYVSFSCGPRLVFTTTVSIGVNIKSSQPKLRSYVPCFIPIQSPVSSPSLDGSRSRPPVTISLLGT